MAGMRYASLRYAVDLKVYGKQLRELMRFQLRQRLQLRRQYLTLVSSPRTSLARAQRQRVSLLVSCAA